VAQRRRRPIAQLTLSDLTASEVKTFLQYTEQERGDTIGTRNCRLSALRSLFSFVADREPTAIEQCTQILHVPMKKAPIHAPCYLEPEEVKAILAQPDRSTIEGQRDHALFSFLYNTGARIQEALDPARRIGCPLQTGAIRRSGSEDHAEPDFEARNTSQLPSCDGGASGCSRC